MGKLISLINLSFSGKVGDVVGGNYRRRHYVKRAPKASDKPKTAKQLAQQARFRLAAETLKPFRSLISRYYSTYHYSSTGLNLAMRYILANAIIESEANPAIDYTKLRFTQGRCRGAKAAFANLSGSQVRITWIVSDVDSYCNALDAVHVLFYAPSINSYIHYANAGMRANQECELTIPYEMRERSVYVYLFFVSEVNIASDTMYAGEIAINAMGRE